MIKKAALTVLVSLALLAGTHAQILTAFDVSGGDGSTSPTAINGTGVISTGINRTTVLAAAAANSFNSNTWNITNTLNTATNYISFTVTASAATTFSTLQYAVSGSNTAPNQGQWAYTLDSGTNFTLGTTANGGAFTNANVTRTAQSTWDFADFSLVAGAAVEFRFFEYGATSIVNGASAATGTTRIANIAGNGNPQYDLVVNGPVAAVQPVNAPEPSTWAFLGGAALLMGLVISRRNRVA